MWLLNTKTHQLEYFEGSNIPPYVILSHRWEDDEVSFKEVLKKRHAHKKGFQKVEMCCKQALQDGVDYAWVDTCCIDKRSSAELSEAINSMYRWYRDAVKCYTYLSDISHAEVKKGRQKITDSAWFTRGWTLQELLAPSDLEFYDHQWISVGSKKQNSTEVQRKTTIPIEALNNYDGKEYRAVQKMSWAAKRQTLRTEDRAYSLIGIFDVNMSLIYGEGERAFTRLLEEIVRTSEDASILASSYPISKDCTYFGASPDSFAYLQDYSMFNNVECSKIPLEGEVDYNDLLRQHVRGVSGTFDLLRSCFDVQFIYLIRCENATAAVMFGIFVVQCGTSDTWRRVELDGEILSTSNGQIVLRHLNSQKLHSRFYFRSLKSIILPRIEPMAIRSSVVFSQPFLHTNYILRPGVCFKRGFSQSARPVDPLFLRCEDIPQDCVLLTSDFPQYVVIHFAFDINSQPMVLTTLFECDSTLFENDRGEKSEHPARNFREYSGVDAFPFSLEEDDRAPPFDCLKAARDFREAEAASSTQQLLNSEARVPKNTRVFWVQGIKIYFVPVHHPANMFNVIFDIPKHHGGKENFPPCWLVENYRCPSEYYRKIPRKESEYQRKRALAESAEQRSLKRPHHKPSALSSLTS